MGFTGKEAAKWKEAYINAFNLMESEIHRIQYSVNRDDVLTASQAEQLRVAMRTTCDKLPKGQQGAFNTKGWSKLKSHFGVTHRNIPQFELSEALSLIARHTAEWELVEPELIAAPTTATYHYPLSAADPHDRKFGNDWMTPRVLIDPKNRALELELIDQLEKNGNDVTGAKIRIIALRDVAARTEQMRSEYSAMADSFGAMSERLRVLAFQHGKNVVFGSKPNPNDPIDHHVYRDQI